jgi:cell division protein FtsL
MPKTSKKARTGATIKRELEIAERELKRITEFQWMYAKRMLKFGFASWIFGVSAFFSVLTIYDSRLLSGTSASIAWPLLVLAAAVPVIIIAVFIRKFVAEIKRLERVRKALLSEYERVILRRVGEIIEK